MCKSYYSAYRDEFNKYTIITPKTYYNGENAPFVVKDSKDGKLYELIIQERIDLGDSVKYVLSLLGFIELGRDYHVIDKFGEKSYLMLGYLCRTKEFNRRYNYLGNDLGSTCNDYGELTFKVWTPTATQVRLVIYNEDSIQYKNMTRDDEGVWSITLGRNYDIVKYRYEITNNLIIKETIDPYAKFSTANGKYSVAYACDLDKMIRPLSRNKCPKLHKATDAVIYELSIRDMTKEGTYTALISKIPYLKDLGITHVQIMPFYDFATVDELHPEEKYNWGYDPQQFMVPEGSFSSDPETPFIRIRELQTMIDELHNADIGVIMDSVYNHVYSRETHPFDALVPTYFFRYNHVGVPTNGSGCGNDVATERRMVRKYIIDCIDYWLKYFAIDGFRFDLMGLMDITTINQIRSLCDKYDKGIILYGEGWDMDTALPLQDKANVNNHCKMRGVGYFNDRFRDYIKGNSFNIWDRGAALGRNIQSNSLQQLLAGSSGITIGDFYMFFSPAQSINYITCHDNYTLWDKIDVALSHKTDEEKRKYHSLALELTIIAQGVPFIHSGCEFFRSKQGLHNTYNSPDEINKINWEDAEKYKDYVNKIKKVIEIRKSYNAFRFDNSIDVKRHLRVNKYWDAIIEYNLYDLQLIDGVNSIKCIFNTRSYDYTIDLDGVYMNIITGEIVENSINVKALESIYLVKI